jgi:transposase
MNEERITDLSAEKGMAVSRRTLQRAVQPTIRFETPAGRQLQIDFGERLAEIGSAKIKAVRGYARHSRRLQVRALRAEKQKHWFAGLEARLRSLAACRRDRHTATRCRGG